MDLEWAIKNDIFNIEGPSIMNLMAQEKKIAQSLEKNRRSESTNPTQEKRQLHEEDTQLLVSSNTPTNSDAKLAILQIKGSHQYTPSNTPSEMTQFNREGHQKSRVKESESLKDFRQKIAENLQATVTTTR